MSKLKFPPRVEFDADDKSTWFFRRLKAEQELRQRLHVRSRRRRGGPYKDALPEGAYLPD